MIDLGFKLSHRIAIYVPTADANGRSVDSASYVEQTLSELSSLFGGATVQAAQGAWNGANGLIREDITICYAFASALTDDDLHKIASLAQQIKSDLDQESVAVELDGALYLS